MRMRRSASNVTVNSGADDDVLPALISSSSSKELTTATSPRLRLVDTSISGRGYVETTIYSLCYGYHRWTVVQ